MESQTVPVKSLTFGSLFAGVGGFDLALSRAGFRSLYAAECDERCNSVRRRHWPDERQFADVALVGGGERPDVLCAGWPCQGNSVAGKRAGMADERSGLWVEVVRVLREQRPRWFLGENVPGLLSVNGGRDFGTVLGDLAQLGYGFAYRILDAQWFGVPQRRRRVFIVGRLGDWRRAAEVLFESEGLPWDSPPRREARTRVAASLTRGTGVGSNDPGRRREDDVNLVGGDIAYACSARDHKGPCSNLGQVSLVAGTLNSGGNDGGFRTEPGEHLIPFDERNVTSNVNRSRCEPGDPSHTLHAFPPTVAYQCHGSNVGPMGTVRAGNGCETGGVPFTAQSTGVRRLTPRETERLQGFPDDWTRYGHDGKEMADSTRYRMCGNAVAVPCVEWIGKRIMEATP